MKKARILQSFNDAGTGKSYEAGKTANLYDAVFHNYAVAGLVELASAAAPETASKPPSDSVSDQAPPEIPPAERAE